MDDVPITAQEAEEFRKFYETRLGGQATSDRTELAAARDMLAAAINDGLTPDVGGGASRIKKGLTDWTDPETIRATQRVTGNSSNRTIASRSGQRQGMASGLIAIGLALGLVTWFLWPAGTADEMMVTGTPTVAVLGAMTPTPLPTLETELMADIVGAGVKTDLVTPRTLDISGVSFVVQPVQVKDGDWPRPDDERAVSWIYGTVVNYVLGLEATTENQALLAAIGAGDELLLRMSTGPTYRFAFIDRIQVAPQASEVFRQTHPGLTLVLLGDETRPTRIILRAVYLPDSELAADKGGDPTPSEPGQAVQLDTLTLTCLGSKVRVQADTPADQVLVVVTFRLSNNGTSLPLLTSSFSHRVEFEGQSFPLASVRIEDPLPITIQPGETFTSTAIYMVPEDFVRRTLTWHFAAGPEGQTATVLLPAYWGRLQASATVIQIGFESESLIAMIQIDAALRPVHLDETDLLLEGAAFGPTSTDFPWQVAPGETGEFTLSLLPESSPVRLGLLTNGFDLTY